LKTNTILPYILFFFTFYLSSSRNKRDILIVPIFLYIYFLEFPEITIKMISENSPLQYDAFASRTLDVPPLTTPGQGARSRS